MTTSAKTTMITVFRNSPPTKNERILLSWITAVRWLFRQGFTYYRYFKSGVGTRTNMVWFESLSISQSARRPPCLFPSPLHQVKTSSGCPLSTPTKTTYIGASAQLCPSLFAKPSHTHYSEKTALIVILLTRTENVKLIDCPSERACLFDV